MDQYEGRRINGIKTIVFAAIAIEAAAYEFTAWGLGDQVARSMDRMEIEGKWMIGTRLICGQSFNATGSAINGLKGLVKARNDLMHHKSKPDDDAGESARKMMKRWTEFENHQVPNAFKTLVLLSLELEALPNSMHGIFPFYQMDIFNDYPRHSGVREAIGRCQEIHRKHQRGL
ncbi:hypothetical protein ACIPL1_18840 [Pseudomonas sp. NPDC090202]|uniref:hypothetical protein n=1 Tax=unclassified Pseudomonas TaxID=196821 RepID=UPI00381FF6ED